MMKQWLALIFIVTTILSMDEPFGSDRMSFFVADGLFGYGANIEITHGGSGSPVDPVPLPAALPLFASGLVGLGLLGWRRKRSGNSSQPIDAKGSLFAQVGRKRSLVQ